MYATIIENQTPGGQRVSLGDALPLDTPFSIQMFPLYGCNFRCSYCLNSLPREKHGFISNTNKMDFSLFQKSIDGMKGFTHKIKMIRFAGMGEPLLHPQIAEMVSYIKASAVCESIHLVTNAALLTPELSEKLVAAGLDFLRISIQGLSAKKYKDVADVDLDFAAFLENIRFLFQHRGNTKIYIKIIDCALDESETKEQFYAMFGNMCDLISIECMTPNVEEIDYVKLSAGRPMERTQNGSSLFQSSICSLPFYMAQINPDGNVVPCCTASTPVIWGNVGETPFQEIWNGAGANQFRRKMLSGTQNCGNICSACQQYHYGLFPEDLLDGYVEKLKPLYN